LPRGIWEEQVDPRPREAGWSPHSTIAGPGSGQRSRLL
jgi:hypothetical protein